MERSKRDLESLVSSQKEQLARYEKRLKDVVTAYKGLLKEKEALEMSLAVKANPNTKEDEQDSNSNVAAAGSHSNDLKEEDKGQLQTLINSLATLSAEKSRMEASFQNDKKQLRAKLNQKDQTVAELQAKIKETVEHANANVEDIKSQLKVERQEREKESNNQMIMIRELQKLYSDERHLKESIEMQLNNFKTQFASTDAENVRLRDLQNELKEAKAIIKEFENGNKKGNNTAVEHDAVLRQLQEEMQKLKDQHATAIKMEQQRVLQAEEQSRKQAALHEDRVANLEERLCELSTTVGTYDRFRQEDQESIQTLKKKLQELTRYSDISTIGSEQLVRQKNVNTIEDVAAIVDEIMRLKKLLIHENARCENPVDVSQIFTVTVTDHTKCQTELKRIEKCFEDVKKELSKAQEMNQLQKTHLWTLQEKVKILNRNIDEQELELKQQNEILRQAVKEERSKWKNIITELENENRVRVNELEQQLQKQRQRSLQLLEEKEQEIKTLKTSFTVFHSASSPSGAANGKNTVDQYTTSSDGESTDAVALDSRPKVLKPRKLSAANENCHMLHYANEIARKDIEIASLRRSKNATETALRKAMHDKVEVCDMMNALEEEVDRLERCKTREGANLEYLKNVIISFITTKDVDMTKKRHMVNAISAVLQFTPTETQSINAAFQKK